MTIRNINPIVNTNTFDQWKSRTNEIITALSDVVTLGGPTANNNAELYIDGDITTSTTLITDEIRPLDNASNTISMRSLVKINEQEIYVSTAGKSNALQFRFGEDADEKSWSIGPVSVGAIHNGLRITGYYPGEIGITPISSYLEIFYADSRDANNAVIPGSISAQNLVLDDAIFPPQIRFSNVKTASTWETARTIFFLDDFNDSVQGQPAVPIGEQGDVKGQITIDGSGDAVCYLKVRNNSHNHNEQYYTKEEINAEYDTVVSNDTRYVRVLPDANPNGDGFLISSIQRGGIRFNDGVPIKWGTLDSAESKWDTSASTFVHRQLAGTIAFATGNNIRFRYANAGGDQEKFNFDVTNGNFVATGNVTAFGSASDRRLKENIEIIPNALDKVSLLNGYTFNYKNKPEEKMTGLIADELEKVLPEVVYDSEQIDGDGNNYKAVRYGNVVGLLVEAIKELKAEIETLKAKG